MSTLKPLLRTVIEAAQSTVLALLDYEPELESTFRRTLKGDPPPRDEVHASLTLIGTHHVRIDLFLPLELARSAANRPDESIDDPQADEPERTRLGARELIERIGARVNTENGASAELHIHEVFIGADQVAPAPQLDCHVIAFRTPKGRFFLQIDLVA